jgi:four helix bundle protein
MNEQMFKDRTKKLGLMVIGLLDQLPHTVAADVIGRQVVRSATSIGANYRAACRAKSTPDMINKLKIVEEESDETAFWLELLTEGNILSDAKTATPYKETNEILAMTVASLNTLRARQSATKRRP